MLQLEVYSDGTTFKKTGGGSWARKEEEYLGSGNGPEVLKHKTIP